MKIFCLATLIMGVISRSSLRRRQKTHLAMLGRHSIQRHDSQFSEYWLREGMKTFQARYNQEPRIMKREGMRSAKECTHPFLCDEMDDNIVVQY